MLESLDVGLLRPDVGDVNRPAACEQFAREEAPSRGERSVRAARYSTNAPAHPCTATDAEPSRPRKAHVAELGLAEPRRVLQHRLEHRLQLAGRARDYLQYLRRRRLLLQRLRELARARLHLVEQPHVLDRDHRLVGEGGGQLDLLVGERLDGSPRQTSARRPETLRAAWARRGRYARPRCGRTERHKFRIGLAVHDVNCLAFQHGAADGRSSIGLDRSDASSEACSSGV